MGKRLHSLFPLRSPEDQESAEVHFLIYRNTSQETIRDTYFTKHFLDFVMNFSDFLSRCYNAFQSMEVSRFFYSQLLFTILISKFKILNFSGVFSEL